MSIEIRTDGSFVSADLSGTLTLEDLDPLLGALEAARRRGPFVVLTDTTALASAPREVVSAFADRLKRMPSLKSAWLGDAVVVTSPAIRFLLSTLVMIAPLPTKVRAFERRGEAERWCADVLRAAGVHAPMAIRF